MTSNIAQGCDSYAETRISADQGSDFDDLVICANLRRKWGGGGGGGGVVTDDLPIFTCIDLNLVKIRYCDQIYSITGTCM